MMQILKICPCCEAEFTARDILQNQDIRPVGMLYDVDATNAWFLLGHEVEGCHSSFAVPVDAMIECIDEEIPNERLTLTDSCEGHCVSIEDLSECRQECCFAPFRRLFLKMLDNRGIMPVQQVDIRL